MGTTVLDAGVVIGFLETTDLHHEAALLALADARDQHDTLLLPASALSECLVRPAREGDQAVAAVRAFLEQLPIAVVSIDEAIAEAAARLRAQHGARLRLPDALVLATAEVLDADTLLTTDRGWPRQDALGLRTEIVEI